MPFGETVLYKRGKLCKKENKLEKKFREGIRGGVAGTSKENIIFTDTGTKLVRTVRRMEDKDKIRPEPLKQGYGAANLGRGEPGRGIQSRGRKAS